MVEIVWSLGRQFQPVFGNILIITCSLSHSRTCSVVLSPGSRSMAPCTPQFCVCACVCVCETDRLSVSVSVSELGLASDPSASLGGHVGGSCSNLGSLCAFP